MSTTWKVLLATLTLLVTDAETRRIVDQGLAGVVNSVIATLVNKLIAEALKLRLSVIAHMEQLFAAAVSPRPPRVGRPRRIGGLGTGPYPMELSARFAAHRRSPPDQPA
jgi:hypothetical protein